MLHHARLSLWFSLLFAVPATLEAAGHVLFGYESLAFADYYWIVSFAALVAIISASMRRRRRAARQGKPFARKARAVFFGVAVWWFALSLSVAVLVYGVGVRGFWARVVMLSGAWLVTSLCSMLACARGMSLDMAEEGSCTARPVIRALFACTLVAGFLRAPLMVPFMLGIAPAGYASEVASIPQLVLFVIPAVLVFAALHTACKVAAARGRLAGALGLCAGEVLMHVCCRFAPNLYLPFIDDVRLAWLVMALATAATAFFIAAVRRARSGGIADDDRVGLQEAAPGEDGAPGVESSGETGASAETLPENAWGLSGREYEAVCCMLAGMSSKEAADTMGVGASTVRSLQSRAWVKMGVASAREARELLGEAKAEEARAEEAPTGEARVGAMPTSASNLRALGTLLCFALFTMALPWRPAGVTWNIPNNACIALGMGVVLYLACSPVLAASARPAHLPSPRREAVKVFVLAIFAVLSWAARMWIPVLLPPVVLMSTVVVLAYLLVDVSVSDTARGCGRASTSELVHVNPASLASLCILMAFAGFACVVCWRTITLPYTASIDPVVWPMGVTILLFAAERLASKHYLEGLGILAAGVFAAVCSAQYGFSTPILLAYLCLFATLGTSQACALPSRLPLACFGGALLCAVALVGHVGHALYGAQVVWGAEQVLEIEARLSLGVGALGAVTVTAATVLCVDRFQRARQQAVAVMSAVVPASRMEAAMVAKGLTSLEVTILLQTFEGRTCVQIAAELHYAPSTVYALRRGAYGKLGAHDAASAFEKVSQLTGM